MVVYMFRLSRASGIDSYARLSALRSGHIGFRWAGAGVLPSVRSSSSSVVRSSKPRRFRSIVGGLFVSGCMYGGYSLSRGMTPDDAEDRALEHDKHQQEEFDRIRKKITRWRLVELLLLMVPIALASPLYFISQKLFWTIVAMQIDRSGPCFIKLAQWLSTRRDMFSDELCECLSVMHERVEAAWSAPVNSKDVVKKLEKNGVHFKRIDDEAVSSGSIGVVYFGELVDGTEVAVKCLRPGVRELLEGDLAWMLHIGDVSTTSPKFALLGLQRAAEEFAGHVQMQVDFQVEATNLRRFNKNFANSGEFVCFPKPLYDDKELLVLTKEAGENLAYIFRAADVIAESKRQQVAKLHSAKATKVFRTPSGAGWPGQKKAAEVKAQYVTEAEMKLLQTRSADIQAALGVPVRTSRKIAAEIMQCYMRMVFSDAFIHGDLHPGNMIVRLHDGAFEGGEGKDADGYSSQVGGLKVQVLSLLPGSIRRLIVNEKPAFELVLIDAGLAIPILPKRVESLRAMACAMLYCDFYGSASHIYDASPDSSKCVDPEAFKDDLASVFRGVRAQIGEAGYMQVSDASLECLRLVRHHRVQLDTGLSWALFAMLSAEGSARQLDPEADCTGAAARYIVTVPSILREMKRQSPEVLQKMVKELIFGRDTKRIVPEGIAAS